MAFDDDNDDGVGIHIWRGLGSMPKCDGQDVAVDGRRQMVYSLADEMYKCLFVLFYGTRVELAARDVAVHDVVIMSFKWGMMTSECA